MSLTSPRFHTILDDKQTPKNLQDVLIKHHKRHIINYYDLLYLLYVL